MFFHSRIEEGRLVMKEQPWRGLMNHQSLIIECLQRIKKVPQSNIGHIIKDNKRIKNTKGIRGKLCENNSVHMEHVPNEKIEGKSKTEPKKLFINGDMANGTKSHLTIQPWEPIKFPKPKNLKFIVCKGLLARSNEGMKAGLSNRLT